MKKFRIILAFSLITGLFILSSCENDEDPVMEPADSTELSIAEFASGNENFSILVEALTKADLVSTLSGTGDFTVFAPDNNAFNALFDALDVSGIEDIPADELKPILLYHVLGSSVLSDKISSSIISSLNETDPEIVVEVTDMGVKLNGSANVVDADIITINGVIHVIDQVILPISNGSILDVAMGLDDFSSLVAALAKANLASTFMMDGEYTVFAPTNDAFASLLTSLGLTLDDLSAADLTPILAYHVIGSKVMSSSLSTGYVNTIYSAVEDYPVSMYVEVGEGVKINSSTSVTLPDVETSNGVIHVIDQVLVPTSVVDIASNNSNFTQLVLAVVKAGLVDVLNAPGPFTIFAPTDDAFMKLYSALEVNGIEQISAEELIPILQYHVVTGNVRSTDLSDGPVATLNGDITFSLAGPVTINGDTEVTAIDIQGANGVIHVINKVLIPAS